MKNLFLCFFALLSINCFASQSSYFNLNEDVLDSEFAELDALENAILSNPGMTASQAVEMNLMTVAQSAERPRSNSEGGFSFEWEEFFWGLLCCPVGLFVVVFDKNRSHDAKVSYWVGAGGCIAFWTIAEITGGVYISGSCIY